MNYKKVYRLSNIFLIVLTICFLFSVKVHAANFFNPPRCNQGISENATLVSIAKDQSAIRIQCPQDNVLIPPGLKANLANLQEGDLVYLEYDGQKNLKSLSVSTVNFNPLERILTGLFIGALFWGIFFVLLGCQNPWNLTIGLDNRYSNSKTQMFSWFFILLTTYITTICLRSWSGGIVFVGGVAIPPNLLIMSGLSAFSFATAKGITQSKVNEAAKGITQSTVNKEENNKFGKAKSPSDKVGKAQFPFDLFHNDNGELDLGDFQMIVITAIAIVVYGFQVYGFLGTIEFHKVVTLPEVDTTLLTSFGVGQGAYLAKKLVGKLGES